MNNIYALYKDDEFIDLGTKKYLSEKIGVKPDTINYYNSQAYKKRIENMKFKGRNSYIVIKIGRE